MRRSRVRSSSSPPNKKATVLWWPFCLVTLEDRTLDRQGECGRETVPADCFVPLDRRSTGIIPDARMSLRTSVRLANPSAMQRARGKGVRQEQTPLLYSRAPKRKLAIPRASSTAFTRRGALLLDFALLMPYSGPRESAAPTDSSRRSRRGNITTHRCVHDG